MHKTNIGERESYELEEQWIAYELAIYRRYSDIE